MTPVRVPNGLNMTVAKFNPASPPGMFADMRPTWESNRGRDPEALENGLVRWSDGQDAPVFRNADAHAIASEYYVRVRLGRIFDPAPTYVAGGLGTARVTLHVQSVATDTLLRGASSVRLGSARVQQSEMSPVRKDTERHRRVPSKAVDSVLAGAYRVRCNADHSTKATRSAAGIGAKRPKRRLRVTQDCR